MENLFVSSASTKQPGDVLSCASRLAPLDLSTTVAELCSSIQIESSRARTRCFELPAVMEDWARVASRLRSSVTTEALHTGDGAREDAFPVSVDRRVPSKQPQTAPFMPLAYLRLCFSKVVREDVDNIISDLEIDSEAMRIEGCSECRIRALVCWQSVVAFIRLAELELKRVVLSIAAAVNAFRGKTAIDDDPTKTPGTN